MSLNSTSRPNKETILNESDPTDNSEANFFFSCKNGRIYITSPYFSDSHGNLTPDFPHFCPSQYQDERSCKIGRHHSRDRKTGPCFPLLVLKCKTHKIGFTVYPPGFAPHGRTLLAPVAPDGSPATEKSGALRFEDTYFDAAIDATNRVFWPSESLEGSMKPRRITQRRHLERASLILGVHPGLDERSREELAQILSLPGQQLLDNAKKFHGSSGDHGRGKAICNILSLIEDSPVMFSRLADAGAAVCLWPWPDRWDPRLKIFQSSPYRPHRTRGAPP